MAQRTHYSAWLKYERSYFRTKASLDFSTLGFQTFGIFGTHTKGSDFSMFGFQTVYEIWMFEGVPLILNGLQQAFLLLVWHSEKVSKIQTQMFRFQTLSEIQTVWKQDEDELSEIQTSLDLRHSL